jgi:hypothetical protein
MNFSHSAEKHLEYCKNHGFDDELDCFEFSNVDSTLKLNIHNTNILAAANER